MTKRIVITGMSVNTPIGDTKEEFLSNLLAGKSAIKKWKAFDTSKIYGKIGGDHTDYDVQAKLKYWEGKIPAEVYKRLKRFVAKSPWSTKLSTLLAVDAFNDAKLFGADVDHDRICTIVAGHNINSNYMVSVREVFEEEPDYIDPLAAVHSLDTDHAASVSELLQTKGSCYTMGAACASGNLALRNAIDEILYHDADIALVVGSVYDVSTIEVHGLALVGAISFESFNEDPERASRPYDTKREGFIPSHGGAVLVVETLDSAVKRGAPIYAEVIGVEANSDGTHLPQPSTEGQARLMTRLLKKTGVKPEQVDFICAHATSTHLGDLTEIRSIKETFGTHAYKLKINAPKSMLGHTCWSAPVVETVAAILQMNSGMLHPSINIDEMDPEVDLDVCANKAQKHEVNYLMKNSFGFGGINVVSLLKKYRE